MFGRKRKEAPTAPPQSPASKAERRDAAPKPTAPAKPATPPAPAVKTRGKMPATPQYAAPIAGAPYVLSATVGAITEKGGPTGYVGDHLYVMTAEDLKQPVSGLLTKIIGTEPADETRAGWANLAHAWGANGHQTSPGTHCEVYALQRGEKPTEPLTWGRVDKGATLESMTAIGVPAQTPGARAYNSVSLQVVRDYTKG